MIEFGFNALKRLSNQSYISSLMYVIVDKETGEPLFDDYIYRSVEEAVERIKFCDPDNCDLWEPQIMQDRWLKTYSFCLYPANDDRQER